MVVDQTDGKLSRYEDTASEYCSFPFLFERHCAHTESPGLSTVAFGPFCSLDQKNGWTVHDHEFVVTLPSTGRSHYR